MLSIGLRNSASFPFAALVMGVLTLVAFGPRAGDHRHTRKNSVSP